MDDRDIYERISKLVDEEHTLSAATVRATG
jgi:hypothetical protein